jgi:hypothetical protein
VKRGGSVSPSSPKPPVLRLTAVTFVSSPWLFFRLIRNRVFARKIRNGAKPVEVSRLKISETFKPHWTGWDAKTQRLVVTGLFLVKLDQAIGALTMDDSEDERRGLGTATVTESISHIRLRI